MDASQVYSREQDCPWSTRCSEQHGQNEGYHLSEPGSPSKRECIPGRIAQKDARSGSIRLIVVSRGRGLQLAQDWWMADRWQGRNPQWFCRASFREPASGLVHRSRDPRDHAVRSWRIHKCASSRRTSSTGREWNQSDPYDGNGTEVFPIPVDDPPDRQDPLAKHPVL
jgi:hypothetical protein